MTQTIPLSQGKVALVDDVDHEWLSQWKWYAAKGEVTYYARRSIWKNGKTKDIQMHRAILNAPLGKLVDHINRNGLDNRRCNIRVCTPSQNLMNARKRRDCLSRYKGVSWNARDQRWQAYIKIDYRQQALGQFRNETEAALAYNEAARELFGEFARLNEIPHKEGSMPSTDELLYAFELYLAQGFSKPNARRMVERKASGPKQRETLRKALDRLIAEKGKNDGTIS